MGTVHERESHSPFHVPYLKITIEMRKKIATARGFPFQAFAQIRRISGEKHEARPSRKVTRHGFPHLQRRREMDEAIFDIHGGTLENPLFPGQFPFG